jgi:hypothetical protein
VKLLMVIVVAGFLLLGQTTVRLERRETEVLHR